MRELILIPAQSGFTARVVDADFEEFDGYTIYPQQDLVTDVDLPPPFVMDAAVYARDAEFPERGARVLSPAIRSGFRVAVLEINPVRFNPVTGALRVARTMTVDVRFAGRDPRNALPHEPAFARARVRQALRRAVLNWNDALPGAPATAAGATNVLVILDDQFEASASLATYLASLETDGSVVESITVSDVADTDAGSVRDYIQEVYDDTAPASLETVIFVGDIGATHIPFLQGTTGFTGDATYSFLEGDDLLADVALGRFPAKNEAQLANMLRKTQIWRDGPSGEWIGKAVLVAHGQGYPGKYTETSEWIRQHLYALTPPEFSTEYGGESATNASLTAEIDNGRMIINYRGHGSAMAWIGWSSTSEYFEADEVAALANTDMPAIVFSIACDNADLTQSDDCLGESFMHHHDGAAAFLGSVQASYTVPNHDFNKYLFQAIYDDGLATLGGAMMDANARLLAHYAGDPTYEEYARRNVDMYLWLGDPLIEIPVGGVLGPSNLAAAALATSSLELTWTDRTDGETGFVLEEATDGAGPFSVVETLAPDTEDYTVTGMNEAEGRYFRVKAQTPEGDSFYTNVEYGQSLANAPTNVNAAAQGTDRALVTWDDESGGEVGYRIRRRPEGGAFEDAGVAGADVTSWTDTGLAEGSRYEYAVDALTVGGASPSAETAAVLTLPAAPTGLDAESVSDRAVTLRWTDASGGENGFLIYRRAPGAADWVEIGAAAADDESYTDASAGEAAEWTYAAAAFNASGVGPLSEACYAMTLPAAPGALVARPVSTERVALDWRDESAAETYLTLWRQVDGGDWEEAAQVPRDVRTYTDAGFTEGTLVQYRLTAANDAGPSAESNTATTRTLPERPTDLTAQASDGGVLLVWRDRSDAELGYKIEREDADGVFVAVAVLGENAEEYLDTTSGAMESRFRVAAYHEYADSGIFERGVGGRRFGRRRSRQRRDRR
ncbi:MAG: C25 family cysteine peptidase [Deltaproteobacteria bacterium]|nr:C25 family cysteine peptidase [Deltaproteobacteria bacterium]